MMQYPLLKFQLMDKLFQAPCINEIFIYQIVCIPVWRNQLFPRCKKRQQLNYDMMAHISSLLCSIECGDILFARQTTRDMETSNYKDTNIFIFLSSENVVFQIKWGRNQLYCFRAIIGLILYLILAFFNAACCIQLQPWSINPKWIRLLGRNLTSHYLYFSKPNIHGMLNFVKLWSGSGVTQEGHAIFCTFGLLGI